VASAGSRRAGAPLATFCLFELFIVCCEALLGEQDQERKDEARSATFFWARLPQQQIRTQYD
jgi:hypothetical protein